MDIDGNTVGRVTLHAGVSINELFWNCERFNMEEQSEQTSAQQTSAPSKPPQPCLRADGKIHSCGVWYFELIVSSKMLGI